MLGSSPLARGLPVRGAGLRRGSWIIPARAGFTGRSPKSRRRQKDHPRSRGVYAATPGGGEYLPGSSPLARGLRPNGDTLPTGQRIIPARAGFTWEKVLYSVAADGSSPLARGLPDAARNILDRIRIIPARAGFTAMTLLGIMNGKDHPRSRGVYSVLPRSSSSAHGSSPLARGLLEEEVYDGEAIGIIPARAGFTCGWRSCTAGTSDHPRSRGVYHLGGPLGWWSVGSSPLARGLPFPRTSLLLGRRIIPARAGFTVSRDRRDEMGEDHPRSRGVYTASFYPAAYFVGSSPLARGLLTIIYSSL